MKVFSFDNTENPVLLIEFKGESLVDACWIPQNPNMIAAIDAEGTVRLYNLADTVEKPKEIVNLGKISSDEFVSIVASPSTNTLSVITGEGQVTSVSLGHDLANDTFVLDKVYVS